MSQVHAQARTTPRTRAEIKESSSSLGALAERYNVSRATARKWKARDCPQDLSHRPENLTDHQRIKLKEVLPYNLKSVRTYLFKEYFQQFWNYESPAWAGKFLDQWCKEVRRPRIDPLKKFVKTVRSHRELLLNYFRPESVTS